MDGRPGNLLRLNPDKTEFILLGTTTQRETVSRHLSLRVMGESLYPADVAGAAPEGGAGGLQPPVGEAYPPSGKCWRGIGRGITFLCSLLEA